MRRKLLSAPYLVWILCGTLIPMAMVFYYGLTGDQGGFTLSNIAAIAETGHAKALWTSVLLSLVSTVICLLSGVSAGTDSEEEQAMGQKGLLVFCVRAADVDEFPAAHDGMAGAPGEEGRDQYDSCSHWDSAAAGA